MDKIATIIVHYNTPADTDNTLASLAKITATNFHQQIYLVDNGSKEEYQPPAATARKLGAHLTVVRSDTNLGFTGGNNLGFLRAKRDLDPDYYLLLNSDTLVKPDFLEQLHGHLVAHSQCGLVSPLIYFAPGYEFHRDSYLKSQRGQVIWFAGGVIDWPNLSAFHQGVDEVNRGQFDQSSQSGPTHPHQFDFATGCCFLMRREIYELVGGFDDRYFLYFEDADLSLRTTQAGYSLDFCPEAQIWHVNGGSTGGSGSDLQRYYQNRNRFLFYWTHGSPKIKLTVLRLAAQYFFGADRILKIAARHFFTGHFGKQVYI